MMTVLRLILAVLGGVALLLLPVSPVVLADTMRVDFDEANPPYMYGSAAAAKGIYPALIREAFERMHVAVQLNAVPWKRALAYLARGTVGVGGIYKTSEREKHFDYSAPIIEETLQLFTRDSFIFPFDRLEDLKGKSIGILAGWSYSDAFAEARKNGLFKAEENRDDAANFDKLALGRLDCVVATGITAQRLLRLHHPAYKSIVALQRPLVVNNTYLAFAKQVNAREILTKFDAAVQAMRQDGTIAKIIERELGAN